MGKFSLVSKSKGMRRPRFRSVVIMRQGWGDSEQGSKGQLEAGDPVPLLGSGFMVWMILLKDKWIIKQEIMPGKL